MSAEAKRSWDQHPTGRSDSPVGVETFPTVAGRGQVHIQEHVVLGIVATIVPHETQGAVGCDRQGGLKLVSGRLIVISPNRCAPFAPPIRGFYQHDVAQDIDRAPIRS